MAESFLLQPIMKQDIITTRFHDVLHCFCFAVVWCTCMPINNNVSVSHDGGLLPDIILLISTTYY